MGRCHIAPLLPTLALQRSSFFFSFCLGKHASFCFFPYPSSMPLPSLLLACLILAEACSRSSPSMISRRRGPNTRRHAAACVGSVLHTSGWLDARDAFLKREGVQRAEQNGRKRKHGAGRAGCRKTPAPTRRLVASSGKWTHQPLQSQASKQKQKTALGDAVSTHLP